jgi:hypothetical protein
VVPSSHAGRPNTRFAIVNPLTSKDLLIQILDSMDEFEASRTVKKGQQ